MRNCNFLNRPCKIVNMGSKSFLKNKFANRSGNWKWNFFLRLTWYDAKTRIFNLGKTRKTLFHLRIETVMFGFIMVAMVRRKEKV